MWEYLIYIIYHELVNEEGLLDVKIKVMRKQLQYLYNLTT